jgi:methionyl-tRNA formyltransferase
MFPILCLRYLLDEGHEIKRVFSFKCDGRFNFNDYVKELAKTAKIPYTERAITEMDIEKLQELGVDCLITAGYSYKIPDLSQTSIKGINIHPTLLPQGRGVWPLPHVILKQLSNSGVTLHKITNEWDGGDILVQQGFSISDSENLESLSARTQMLATTLLKQTLSNLDQLWQQAQAQEGEISNWPMPDSNDRFIRWQMGVEQIDRICRAFGKFSAFAVFEDRLWNVYDLTA